jgi:hypothetical protein
MALRRHRDGATRRPPLGLDEQSLYLQEDMAVSLSLLEGVPSRRSCRSA